MAFTTPGSYGPVALKDTAGKPVTNATVTVPAGYTATQDGLGNLTITGPPADDVVFTVHVPGQAARSFTVDIPAAVSEVGERLADVELFVASAPGTFVAFGALWLPGTAGNFVSTPDRNLLTAERSVGAAGWASNSVNATVTSGDTTRSYEGTSSVKVSWAATETSGANTFGSTHTAVTAETTYTLTAYVWCASARTFTASLRFRDASNVSTGDLSGAATAVPASTWTRVSVTATAPANSVTAFAQVVMGATSGDVAWIDAAQMEQASSASAFTPSLRVTGDLDLRAHVALEDWTPGAVQALVAKWHDPSAQRSYLLRANTNGALILNWSPDGVNGIRVDSTATVPFTDGQPAHVRATLDVDNGASGRTIRFLTSTDGTTWTQLGTDLVQSGVTSIIASSSNLTVGARSDGTNPLRGKVLSASVRAGIDGPVVADVEFRAPVNAWTNPGATRKDKTGKLWTINGNEWEWRSL
jgi:hypothetical protein